MYVHIKRTRGAVFVSENDHYMTCFANKELQPFYASSYSSALLYSLHRQNLCVNTRVRQSDRGYPSPSGGSVLRIILLRTHDGPRKFEGL